MLLESLSPFCEWPQASRRVILVALWNSINKEYETNSYSILKKENTVINKGHLNSEGELIFGPFSLSKKKEA